jgi:DNA-binding transcriptional ArsR family regulator
MDAELDEDATVAAIAAAIGEPARARMLFCLMDGAARTSTELSVVAEVSPSTASAHLARLREAGLVAVIAQGRHRYFRLASGEVAAVLESLGVLAGGRPRPGPRTPSRLRAARACYDHLAGAAGVAIHDRLLALGWIAPPPGGPADAYEVTPAGDRALGELGIDLAEARARRRRFAGACLDWSERRPHLGGALGAALLSLALARGWLERDLDSRALTVTPRGRKALAERLGAAL